MPNKQPAVSAQIPVDESVPLHVLVVDDVAMNRDIAGSFLRAAGYNVTCVESGSEAIAAIMATNFSVVLMDVRMPEMDGLEATRRIRALPGAHGRIPIVALTARAFTEQVAECREAGMDSHVAKPFTPDTLHNAVLRAIEVEAKQGKTATELTGPCGTSAPSTIQTASEPMTTGRSGTNLVLEPAYWAALDSICRLCNVPFNVFVAEACQIYPNYAADIAIRIAAATYFAERYVSASTVCSDEISAPASSLIGLEKLVLNETAYERAAHLLPSDTIGSYVQTIAKRAEALLEDLSITDACRSSDTALAGEANAIAGIAGLFGFDRLTYVGRHFERGIDARSADSPALAAGLRAALKETLSVIHNRTLATAQA